jgi:hypothetical protein
MVAFENKPLFLSVNQVALEQVMNGFAVCVMHPTRHFFLNNLITFSKIARKFEA